MALICDLWEDIQFYFGFEGLVVFCLGESNRWADAASRVFDDSVEAAFDLQFEQSQWDPPPYVKIPVTWTIGSMSCAVEGMIVALQ